MSTYEARDQSDHCIIYSFGVSRESSFEAQLLQRTTCEIWGYDFSVTSWGPEVTNLSNAHQARAHFQKVGLGESVDLSRNPPYQTIQSLMQENGHAFVDLIKMDIEGAEYDVLRSLMEDTKDGLPFGQLLMEVHLIPEDLLTSRGKAMYLPKSLAAWLKFWESLEDRGMRVVFTEPNLVGNMGPGRGEPRFSEVSGYF